MQFAVGWTTVSTRPFAKSTAATIVSFKVSHVLAKHKKVFEDPELMRETFLGAAHLLSNDFKTRRK